MLEVIDDVELPPIYITDKFRRIEPWITWRLTLPNAESPS
jgi:hypothetical protein